MDKDTKVLLMAVIITIVALVFFNLSDLTGKVTTSTSDCECSYNKYNCADFKTYSEAKACYNKCGGINDDIHHLDGDKDGIPCESLRKND